MVDLNAKNILFGSLFGVAFLAFYLTSRIYKFLELRYSKEYEQLGKPTIFLNNSISSNFLFLRFLFKGEWKKLGDRDLESLCRRLFLLYFVFWSIFVSMFFV